MAPGSMKSRGVLEPHAVPKMFCRRFTRGITVIMMQLTCNSNRIAVLASADTIVNAERTQYNRCNEGH